METSNFAVENLALSKYFAYTYTEARRYNPQMLSGFLRLILSRLDPCYHPVIRGSALSTRVMWAIVLSDIIKSQLCGDNTSS